MRVVYQARLTPDHHHMAMVNHRITAEMHGSGFGHWLRKGLSTVGHAIAPIAKQALHDAIGVGINSLTGNSGPLSNNLQKKTAAAGGGTKSAPAAAAAEDAAENAMFGGAVRRKRAAPRKKPAKRARPF